ncbi:uncharacterized protein LOC124939458 [Impatiens glandulifera]|uniref:uncharacterized protein LOC124939458 n=1 Tax=Impatiens glandulifera TaxID=253017 RepID=UPI001FB05BE0|nr:uncharacterized protein LOC124939458 [Impatiens glandulifera]
MAENKEGNLSSENEKGVEISEGDLLSPNREKGVEIAKEGELLSRSRKKSLEITKEGELLSPSPKKRVEITKEGELLSRNREKSVEITEEDELVSPYPKKDVETTEDDSSPWGDLMEQLMMQVLPSNGIVSKEAEEMMQRFTMKFISFVTMEANVICKKEKSLILRDKDIAWAIEILGFKDILDRYKVLDEDLIQSYMQINTKPLQFD